jgi:hypothetical protein
MDKEGKFLRNLIHYDDSESTPGCNNLKSVVEMNAIVSRPTLPIKHTKFCHYYQPPLTQPASKAFSKLFIKFIIAQTKFRLSP